MQHRIIVRLFALGLLPLVGVAVLQLGFVNVGSGSSQNAQSRLRAEVSAEWARGVAWRPLADDLRGTVEVVETDGEGLRIRAAADVEAETRAVLREGTLVEIVAGPIQAGGRTWYQVGYGAARETGWAAAQFLGPPSRGAASGGGRAAATALAQEPQPSFWIDPGPLPADWREALVAPGPTVHLPVRPLPEVASTDQRFGLVEAFRLNQHGLADKLGARHQRLTFWWSGLQHGPGASLNPYYLPLDMVDGERARGVDLIGLIINTPEWAAANRSHGPSAVPRNLHLPWDAQENFWGRFVERLARDYAGRIDDWIIWNEPDIVTGDPNDSYYTWAGSLDDYFDLLRVGYRGIKAGNPNARVHLAGLTYWTDQRANRPQYFARLLDRIAADPAAAAHNQYFDVVSLHLYTDPRGLYRVPRLYRELLHGHGWDKPIWVNETNVIPWDDPLNSGTGADSPTDMRCTLADQASFLLQAFALGLAADVQRIAVYKAEDSSGAAFNAQVDPIERSALVREDGSLRPAFVAYQTAVSHLQGAFAAYYYPSPLAESVVVERIGRQRTTVLWNSAPFPVVGRVPVAGGTATLVDASGQSLPLLKTTPDGSYAIVLPPATCNTDPDDPTRYLVGGETYLIVEDDVPADRTPSGARSEPIP